MALRSEKPAFRISLWPLTVFFRNKLSEQALEKPECNMLVVFPLPCKKWSSFLELFLDTTYPRLPKIVFASHNAHDFGRRQNTDPSKPRAIATKLNHVTFWCRALVPSVGVEMPFRDFGFAKTAQGRNWSTEHWGLELRVTEVAVGRSR